MSRADVNVETTVATNNRNCGQSNHIVRLANGIWYMFFTDGSASTVYYRKSTNYGLSWNLPVQIKATSAARGVACWFDQWTPGDSGTVIHLAYFESTTSDVFYRALDTASDTLGTEITILNGASANNNENTCISVTKSRGGRILVAFDIDGGTETGFYKSDDFPVTAFTSKTDVNEATSDYYLLFPGNDADSADIYAVYWDRSADEISLKVYDDSGNSWAETSIAASMVDVSAATVASQFSGSVRLSDGHLIMAAWSNADTANADLRLWDINGSGSITEKTNVVLNSTDDQAACAVGVDTSNDYIYVFYLGKSDGSETAYTSLNVYYKVSIDGGVNWGAETLLSLSARGITYLNCSPIFSRGDFAVCFLAPAVGAALGLLNSAMRGASVKPSYILGGM